MGRIATNGPHTDPKSVFRQGVNLALSRRLVTPVSEDRIIAFADAFLVAWFRANGRRDLAAAARRNLLDMEAVRRGTLSEVVP